MSVALPTPRDLPKFAPLHVARTRLSNGLEVIIARKPSLPILDLQLVVRGGGTIDPPAQAGRASLTAEMLDEGTRQRSALEISAYVEQLGADLDLRAGWDACFLSLHGLAHRFEPALGLVAEVVLQPTFPADEYERKHEERLHALQQEKDEPRTVAVKALARAIFGRDHAFGQPLGGTVQSVAELRGDAIEAFYRHTFAPGQAHLILAGDIEEENAVRLIERELGAWQASARVETALAPPANSEKGIYLIDRPGAAQSEVRFGHIGVRRDTADYFPLIVMNTILGGSFKSRLNMKLREEKGFTYGASTFFSFRRAGGSFGGGAAVFTGATGETVALSLAELRRMADGDVSSEELNRARNYLSLGFMRNFETTADIAGHLAEVALYDLPGDYLGTYADRVAAVSAEDVRRVAQKYLLPELLSVVVVGDRQRVLPQLQQLAVGPIHDWDAE